MNRSRFAHGNFIHDSGRNDVGARERWIAEVAILNGCTGDSAIAALALGARRERFRYVRYGGKPTHPNFIQPEKNFDKDIRYNSRKLYNSKL